MRFLSRLSHLAATPGVGIIIGTILLLWGLS